jgi:hypothetical protein
MTLTLVSLVFLVATIWAGVLRQWPLALIALGLFLGAAGIDAKLG